MAWASGWLSRGWCVGGGGVWGVGWVEGRHAHERGRLRHGGQDRVGIEFGQEDGRGAGEERDVGRNEQPVRVKDRQGVDQDVFAGEAPVIAQHVRV